MPDINVNKLSEALNTKADIDLNNTGVFSTSEGGWVSLTSSTPANANGKEVTSADFIKSDIQSNLLNYTTNRILEIPQDIKLELNNGKLTLKAGSKVCVPNGSGNFDVITTTQDYAADTSSYSGMYVLAFVNGNPTGVTIITNPVSGDTAPTSPVSLQGWYDTTNNLVKRYNNGWQTPIHSFPLAICASDGTNITSIDQVFNGFGYIGSHFFVLPGVKVQIPDERNEDGSYKTFSVKTNSVTTASFPNTVQGGMNWYIDNLGNAAYYGLNYIKFSENNLWESTDGKGYILKGVVVATSDVTSGVISNYKSCIVDSVANSNASNFSQAGRSYLSSLGMPSNKYINLTLGASGSTYTAPANGWFSLDTWTTSTATAYYQLHNRASDLALLAVPDQGHVYQQKGFIPCKAGDIVAFIYENIDTTKTKWRFIYAQGDQ